MGPPRPKRYRRATNGEAINAEARNTATQAANALTGAPISHSGQGAITMPIPSGITSNSRRRIRRTTPSFCATGRGYHRPDAVGSDETFCHGRSIDGHRLPNEMTSGRDRYLRRHGGPLMKRSTGTALVLALVLAGCTSKPGSETSEPTGSPAAPSVSPSAAPASDIQFILADAYSPSDRVVVRIRNVGDVTYRYQFMYQACFLSYLDSAGRGFIIPPGTHCDIRGWAPLRPGEVKRLFTWDLDECLKDEWGCSKSAPLDPGIYTVRGTFKPTDGGTPTRAEATFEIQPVS